MRNLKEETFYLASYFDSRMRGLDDNYQTSDATEAEDWAWEHLNQGGYVEIKNQKTGKEVYLDPDDLLDDYADYASGAFEDAINDSGVLEEDMGREIKRYSDVYSDERRNQGWWYFTTHGVQPGSVPKDVNILEVRDTPNGTYFRVDAILNTSELKYYDIKERVPKEEESLKEDASMDSAQRLEDDGWDVFSYGIWGADKNYYWLARRFNKERGKGEWKAINDKTGEVIDITYEQALEREPIGVSSGVSKLSKKLGKVLLPQKINIRESLNKYDLRTDNKYDLRNLYDACIMTDKEKRIIAEMISKNARANVLYEALMNKFEGKELKETLDSIRFSSDDLKRKAQVLYDNGFITYNQLIWGGVSEKDIDKLYSDNFDDNGKQRRKSKYKKSRYKKESLKEADERNADLDKGIKDEQETINLYDKMSKKKVFNGVEKDQIKEIRNDEKDHKRLLKKIKDGKLTRVEEAYDDDETYNRMRERIMPMVDALHEFEGDMRDFRMTYSFGVDDNGNITGGVDFDRARDSELSEEEIKSRFEEIFDENGFELDRRFKTNPGKTLFGRTHYQIIERDTK